MVVVVFVEPCLIVVAVSQLMSAGIERQLTVYFWGLSVYSRVHSGPASQLGRGENVWGQTQAAALASSRAATH